MLRFEPESSCLCCTIFVTILWFSVRKRKETAENSSPQTTPQSRMATLFLKKEYLLLVSAEARSPPKKIPGLWEQHRLTKDFQQKHGFASSGEGSLCAVDSESRRSGSLLQRLSLSPMSLLVTLCFPWCSSPCPFLILFSFLACHSFAFFLEVYRGNQGRLEQNKNHLHLSQALRYLSQLW